MNMNTYLSLEKIVSDEVAAVIGSTVMYRLILAGRRKRCFQVFYPLNGKRVNRNVGSIAAAVFSDFLVIGTR